MRPTRQIRRLAGYGWAIETTEGVPCGIRRDDGTELAVGNRLMGTREAARFLGVQPPNFVRDWASRPDFPAPVTALASGRVWLATDVERYAMSRHAPTPSGERIAQIARRSAWWQKPKPTLERPLAFVARVMASGSFDEVHDIELFFGRRFLRLALTNSSPGVFDRRSWNYWLIVLGVDRTIPLPARHVP